MLCYPKDVWHTADNGKAWYRGNTAEQGTTGKAVA